MKHLFMLLISAVTALASPAGVVTASRNVREYVSSVSTPTVLKEISVEERLVFLSEELIEARWKAARERGIWSAVTVLKDFDLLIERVEVLLSRAASAGANLKPERLTELRRALETSTDELKRRVRNGDYP